MFKNFKNDVQHGLGLGLAVIVLVAMPVVVAMRVGGFDAATHGRVADAFSVSAIAGHVVERPTTSMHEAAREAREVGQTTESLIYALYGAAYLVALSLGCWTIWAVDKQSATTSRQGSRGDS